MVTVMPWSSPVPDWSQRRSFGFSDKVAVGAVAAVIVTCWPSDGVVATWYSGP